MAKGTEAGLRRDLVEVCRRLHDRRLLGAGEGNVSCRLARDLPKDKLAGIARHLEQDKAFEFVSVSE